MFAALTVMTRLRAYSGQVVFTLIDLAPGPLCALLCPAIHQHSYTSSNAIKTSFAFGKNMIVVIYPIFFFQERIKQHQDCDEDLQELPWQNCSYFFLKCWMLIPRVLSAPQYFLQMWLVIQWYRERIPWLKFRSGVCSNIVCSIIQSVMANLNLLKCFLQSRYNWNIFVT